MLTGKMIAIEGPDGVGKSTQAQLLAKNIQETYGITCHVYGEPGGTEVGALVRDIVKDGNINLSLPAQFALICAARAQLLEEKIIPAILSDEWIVLDRYKLSSLVYQRGFGQPRIDAISNLFNFPDPDMYIFLDLEPQQISTRLDVTVPDRFDNDGDNINRLFEFRRLAARVQSYGKCDIIDSSNDVHTVASNILEKVRVRFKL